MSKTLEYNDIVGLVQLFQDSGYQSLFQCPGCPYSNVGEFESALKELQITFLTKLVKKVLKKRERDSSDKNKRSKQKKNKGSKVTDNTNARGDNTTGTSYNNILNSKTSDCGFSKKINSKMKFDNSNSEKDNLFKCGDHKSNIDVTNTYSITVPRASINTGGCSEPGIDTEDLTDQKYLLKIDVLATIKLEPEHRTNDKTTSQERRVYSKFRGMTSKSNVNPTFKSIERVESRLGLNMSNLNIKKSNSPLAWRCERSVTNTHPFPNSLDNFVNKITDCWLSRKRKESGSKIFKNDFLSTTQNKPIKSSILCCNEIRRDNRNEKRFVSFAKSSKQIENPNVNSLKNKNFVSKEVKSRNLSVLKRIQSEQRNRSNLVLKKNSVFNKRKISQTVDVLRSDKENDSTKYLSASSDYCKDINNYSDESLSTSCKASSSVKNIKVASKYTFVAGGEGDKGVDEKNVNNKRSNNDGTKNTFENIATREKFGTTEKASVDPIEENIYKYFQVVNTNIENSPNPPIMKKCLSESTCNEKMAERNRSLSERYHGRRKSKILDQRKEMFDDKLFCKQISDKFIDNLTNRNGNKEIGYISSVSSVKMNGGDAPFRSKVFSKLTKECLLKVSKLSGEKEKSRERSRTKRKRVEFKYKKTRSIEKKKKRKSKIKIGELYSKIKLNQSKTVREQEFTEHNAKFVKGWLSKISSVSKIGLANKKAFSSLDQATNLIKKIGRGKLKPDTVISNDANTFFDSTTAVQGSCETFS